MDCGINVYACGRFRREPPLPPDRWRMEFRCLLPVAAEAATVINRMSGHPNPGRPHRLTMVLDRLLADFSVTDSRHVLGQLKNAAGDDPSEQAAVQLFEQMLSCEDTVLSLMELTDARDYRQLLDTFRALDPALADWVDGARRHGNAYLNDT